MKFVYIIIYFLSLVLVVTSVVDSKLFFILQKYFLYLFTYCAKIKNTINYEAYHFKFRVA